VWPACETLHFLGMSLMFGVLMIVNLRLLGFLRGNVVRLGAPAAAFGLIGLRHHFITGMFFLRRGVGAVTRRTWAFHYKVVLLMPRGA